MLQGLVLITTSVEVEPINIWGTKNMGNEIPPNLICSFYISLPRFIVAVRRPEVAATHLWFIFGVFLYFLVQAGKY